jgi:hypothetical protein
MRKSDAIIWKSFPRKISQICTNSINLLKLLQLEKNCSIQQELFTLEQICSIYNKFAYLCYKLEQIGYIFL